MILLWMEQEGRALPRPALPFTIDSADVSAERVCSSLLTFPKLRANNTSVGIVGQIPKNARRPLASERDSRKKERERERRDFRIYKSSISFVSLMKRNFPVLKSIDGLLWTN